ncbi:hypothetical protein G7054_g10686 [Neopestalotiopsis clavispora]|nr:hypothetical protein G7054_g10686 [Neopestalotiopsis clavispora]
MKTFQSFAILLLAAAGVYAAPSASDVETIQDSGFTYKGLSQGTIETRSLEARCGENFPPHSDCVIGQCQCSAGYGCYSCNGGRVQCQPGPGSGQCWT